MPIKEANRLRLARLTARFSARRANAQGVDAQGAFDAGFEKIRGEVLVPLLRELGAELETGGHAFVIDIDGDPRRPSVVFRVNLAGGNMGNANAIGFFAQHEPKSVVSEVIAYLALKNEFELGRFKSLAEMTRERLEQMLVDALEHLIVCNG